MSTPIHPAESSDEPAATPRADLKDGLFWLCLGTAITIISWRMDRLQEQHINPYTVPGLVPGMIGLAMLLLGALLAYRGWRVGSRLFARSMPAGAIAQAEPGPHGHHAARWRIAIVLALCLSFAVGLVGHGLPFWAAAAIFVTASVLILQVAERKIAGVDLPRKFLVAVAIGLGAGGLITLVFQDIFLVYLP